VSQFSTADCADRLIALVGHRACNLMEIQGRGSIVVKLLVKVKACSLKNSLAHTLEAWRSSK